MMDDLITEIKPEKHGATVTVNETEKLWFNRAAWAEQSLEIGQSVDLTELRKWLLPRQYPEALNAAVRLLAVRARSEAELAQRLRQRGYMDDTVDMVLYQLERNKLTDDEAFARDWVKSRLRAGLGQNRVRMELRQKGVDDETVQRVLAETDKDEQDESAKALAAKLLRRYGSLEPREAIAKVMAGMSRRGYGYDEAKNAVENALHDAEGDD